MPLSTKKMRNLIEKYEKWFMIALIVFLLLIFTVTEEMMSVLSPTDSSTEGPIPASEVVGSFYVVPKDQVRITYKEFARAQNAVRVWNTLQFGAQREIGDLDVWTHLILREAARTQGITVSNEELVSNLRQSPLSIVMGNKEQYKRFTREQFQMNLAEFEYAYRDAMIARRVRRLYMDTFLVAPPATREELVEKFAPGSFEFVELTWAALDAGRFLESEVAAIGEGEEAEKKLREFFEADPAVKEESVHFRYPRRYEIELLYALHDRLTEEKLARAKAMFLKAWPEWDASDTLRRDAFDFGGETEIQNYWASYKERLLKAEGRTLEELREQATRQVDAAGKKDGAEKDGAEKDGAEKDGEAKDGEEKDGEAKDEPALAEAEREAARQQAIAEAMERNGIVLCRDRIVRELELRRLYRRIHTTAYENPGESLKKCWERLKEFDDENDPLCTLEVGTGLFLFRAPEKALSRNEVESMKDGEFTFGPNVGLRVSQAGRQKLPFVRESAEVMGDAAQGRMIVRVKGVERERRKTFDELDEGEKAILKTEFYGPHRARERARAVLEELKKKVEEGAVKPDGFAEAAASLHARVFEGEQLTAKSGYVPEPDERLLFPSALEHMRDRHYLRSRLASLLASDRIKKEEERLKPGSWLDVQVRSETEEPTEDPGAAYLVLLLDRRKPDAATMPEETLQTARRIAMQQGAGRDRDRWDNRPEQLLKDFEVEFYGRMKGRVDAALERRREDERRRANQGS